MVHNEYTTIYTLSFIRSANCEMSLMMLFHRSKFTINDIPNTTMDINDCLCLNNISMTGCVYQLYIITSILMAAGGI